MALSEQLWDARSPLFCYEIILPQFYSAHWTVSDLSPRAFALKFPNCELKFGCRIVQKLSCSPSVVSPWLSGSAVSCLTQSFCQNLALSSTSFRLSATIFLKETYSWTFLLHSWIATVVVSPFHWIPLVFVSRFSFLALKIFLARFTTASTLPRSVHPITRVSKS